MQKKDDYLIVGRITKPSGIKGEVKVLPITDGPGRYRKLSAVYIESGGTYRKLAIEKTRVNGGRVVLKFSGCSSIEDAELLRDELLFVTRKKAVKIPKGSYYYYDILGCTVTTLEGAVVGEVYDIQNAGSCDVYCVRSPGERSREFMIPAIRDVVKKIDVGEKKIVIETLEGLL